MARHTYANELDFIGEVLADKLSDQPKYKKISNTITASVGALLTVVSQVLLLPLDLPDWVMWSALGLTSLATVLGVNKTKNGFSDSQVEKLRQWQAEYVDRQHNLAHARVNESTGLPHAAEVERAHSRDEISLSSTMNAEDLGRMIDRFLDRRG